MDVNRARKPSGDDIGVAANLFTHSVRTKAPFLRHKTIAEFYNRSSSASSSTSIDQPGASLLLRNTNWFSANEKRGLDLVQTCLFYILSTSTYCLRFCVPDNKGNLRKFLNFVSTIIQKIQTQMDRINSCVSLRQIECTYGVTIVCAITMLFRSRSPSQNLMTFYVNSNLPLSKMTVFVVLRFVNIFYWHFVICSILWVLHAIVLHVTYEAP